MDDVFGTVLTIIKNDTAVAAIVSTRVSSEVQAVPCVQLIDNAASRYPFGPGSGRMRYQHWQGVARCWSADTPTGAIQARQLAGAVSDAIHNMRPVTTGGKHIRVGYTPEVDGLERDPITHRPFYDVVINVKAATNAVA